jgi:hypothetical protein
VYIGTLCKREYLYHVLALRPRNWAQVKKHLNFNSSIAATVPNVEKNQVLGSQVTENQVPESSLKKLAEDCFESGG